MLRYLSLVPITVRLTTRDLPLSKEIKIPKGSTCLIDLSWSAFHGSWPDPENFNLKNAEYFLNLNEKEQSNMLFKPFSDSPHLCYGQVLVGAIFKKTIYKMLKEYSFSTNYQGNFFPRKNGRISISQQDVKLHFRAATAASQGSEALASSPR
jgi:cytochrome P450